MKFATYATMSWEGDPFSNKIKEGIVVPRQEGMAAKSQKHQKSSSNTGFRFWKYSTERWVDGQTEGQVWMMDM